MLWGEGSRKNPPFLGVLFQIYRGLVCGEVDFEDSAHGWVEEVCERTGFGKLVGVDVEVNNKAR